MSPGKSTVFLVCILATGLSAAVDTLAPTAVPSTVDERTVLRIGPHEMSQYILDKYFIRFANAERQKQSDFPAREAKRAWLELFLAQQLITAYAKTQGYAQRSEVQHIVSIMERYMLTQREGPFYQSLYDHEPVAETRQALLYAESLSVRQILMVHFSQDADARAALGSDFSNLLADEKLRRINRCREDGNAVIYDGPISWPFEPFCEISDFLGTTSAGEWFHHTEADLGTYDGFVREIKIPEAVPSPVDKARFAAQITEIDKRKVQRQRHARLLAASAFQFNESTLMRLAESLGRLSASTPRIPADQVASMEALPLFNYHSGSEPITVTVGDYCRHFNNLMIRRFPGTLSILRLDAENMAIEELDFREARAAGIPNSPEFVEDRRGFLGMQTLDLFEKEKLLPAIHVTPDEIGHYYHEHVAEFSRIIKIGGRLLIFENKEQSETWQRDHSLTSLATSVEISSDQPLPGFEAIHQAIIQGPIGVPWGPVKTKKGYAVLIKEQNLETTPPALSDATTLIQTKLQRQHLDEKELSLAAELGGQFKIEDQIDYNRYGVTREEINLPWHK